MTAKEFDELPLSDQICIYHRFPEAYSRLIGKTVDDTATKDTSEPTPEDRAKAFADAIVEATLEDAELEPVTVSNARMMTASL